MVTSCVDEVMCEVSCMICSDVWSLDVEKTVVAKLTHDWSDALCSIE